MSFTLPSLPYSPTSLADKGMCEETLGLHHGKHHQGYVNTLNTLLEKHTDLASLSLEEIVCKAHAQESLTPVFNNAGQHWNHSLFWNSLSPQGGKLPGKLKQKLEEDFGSVEAFKEAFKTAATTQFGSGWAWLILKKDGKLAVTKSSNADSPLARNEGKALLVCDVWEHSYYVDFRNRRPDYVQNFLDNLINYEFAEARLMSA